MKKTFLIIAAALATLTANAQYRDVKLPEKPKQTGYRDYNNQDNGFWFAVEAEGGCSAMTHSPNMPYASATLTGGYRVSEFLRAGVGFGARVYFNHYEVRGDADSRYGVPVFANVRGNFISAADRDGVPFWSVNVGGITNEGFFASPTIGYSFGGLRNNFLIGVSYTLSTFRDCDKKSQAYSSFGLKLGYEF